MSIPTLLAEALRTKKEFHIGLLRQFCESAYLRYSQCRLDPWEYYFFQVYLDRYPMKEKRRFTGWRREVHLDRLANKRSARNIANDKLSFYSFMRPKGAPLPRMSAVYSFDTRGFPGAVKLRDKDAVAGHLRHPANAPLFVKPIRGAHGQQTYAISRPSADRQDLDLLCGRRIGLQDFVTTLDASNGSGFLFQELLQTHDTTGRICGDRLTSVRIIVILTANGPEILSAIWKIPTGTNVTDNFDVGRTGNIVAGVELGTGRVRHVVQGNNWKNIPVDRHPDTGVAFDRFRLPDWRQATELCLDYARHFPALCLQHWDIALTRSGPVIMELNVAGGMRTHQIVQQRGIFGERLRQLGSDANRL